MIATDLRKHQALDAYLKATQQINFIGDLSQRGGSKMFFIIENAEENILDFWQGTVGKVLWFYFALI